MNTLSIQTPTGLHVVFDGSIVVLTYTDSDGRVNQIPMDAVTATNIGVIAENVSECGRCHGDGSVIEEEEHFNDSGRLLIRERVLCPAPCCYDGLFVDPAADKAIAELEGKGEESPRKAAG